MPNDRDGGADTGTDMDERRATAAVMEAHRSQGGYRPVKLMGECQVCHEVLSIEYLKGRLEGLVCTPCQERGQ